MKLTKVRVQNFRSIVDSGIVDIEDKVTVLVGKNEQGKTTFLRGILSLTLKSRYTADDLPNHLRATLEEKQPGEIPIVCAWLSPDDEERHELTILLANGEDVSEFIVTRYYDAHFSYRAKLKNTNEIEVKFTPPDITKYVEELTKAVFTLQQRLEAHAVRLPAFAAAIPQAASNNQQFLTGNFKDRASLDNLFETFATTLKALPGQDPAIQADVATATKEIETLQERIHAYGQ